MQENTELNREISNEEIQKAVGIINRLFSYYNSKVVGQPGLGYSLLVAMMTNGHVLLESVPGLAKTTAARVMTEAVNGSFSRIQCTPDLIPSDIIGTQMYNMATNTFEDKIGPVYSNFVLLDEINRSSAKTQSAMLEAMQEREVSIGGKTYKLPEVFVVIATQNPIESEGTYVLSEALLDRFLLSGVRCIYKYQRGGIHGGCAVSSEAVQESIYRSGYKEIHSRYCSGIEKY